MVQQWTSFNARDGPRDRSRRRSLPTAAPALVRAIVRPAALVGNGRLWPTAIQPRFERLGGPSLTTIKGLAAARESPPPPRVIFPDRAVLDGVLHAMDWTCRYLEDGVKVYAFHTLNLRTRALLKRSPDKQG